VSWHVMAGEGEEKRFNAEDAETAEFAEKRRG
jgi:hypothetical protein